MLQWYTAVKRMAPGKTTNFISLAIEWVYLLDGGSWYITVQVHQVIPELAFLDPRNLS